MRCLLVLTGGREEAVREALQLTLVRVVHHIRRFDSPEVFWSWLTVLARSSLVDEERKRKRYFGLLDGFLAGARRDDFDPPRDADGSLLQHTLLQVRRRSRARKLNRALLAVAVVAAVPMLLWKFSSPPPRPPQAVVPQPPFGIVTTQPLPREMIVKTRPGSVSFFTSSPTTVAYVETGDAKGLFQEITDEQLFSLLAGRPAALVRSGPNRAELIFLHPEDQQGFRVP